jgi:tetratricopeptide (TPR) repeat protein
MATTVSNTNADAWFWVGRTYEAMGNKQQAIINYQRALSLEPEFSEAQQRLRKLK